MPGGVSNLKVIGQEALEDATVAAAIPPPLPPLPPPLQLPDLEAVHSGLKELVAIKRDELVGRGQFQRKAKGERRSVLEQQINQLQEIVDALEESP